MIGERKMKSNSLRAYLSLISIFSQLHFSDAPGNRRSTHRRLVMKGSMPKMACIAAMLVLMLGLASSAWATGYFGGVPWQVNDVIICFGSGTCNVVRIVGGVPQLLDQFSDTQMGDTHGVAINNTLHAVITDNGAGSDSNVVAYTIASVVPSLTLAGSGTPIAHTPVSISNASPNNAQAVVVNGTGHIFVG